MKVKYGDLSNIIILSTLEGRYIKLACLSGRDTTDRLISVVSLKTLNFLSSLSSTFTEKKTCCFMLWSSFLVI